MEDLVLIYTTWPDMASAEATGRALVAGRLAACVNILPGMVSVYAWQGAIERAEEVVMIIKTSAARRDAVMAAVAEQHPYETPAILVTDVAAVHPAYGAWVVAASGGAKG